MTVLDSGFHAVDSGFQVLDSSLSHWNFFVIFLIISFRLSLELGFWIPIVSGSPDSSSWYSGDPVTRKMVKFNPGLSEISSKVFLSKDMSLELTTYCCVFPPRSSDDYIECYSKQYIGR